MKRIILLLLAHISLCAVAKTVSPAEALDKALRFVQPTATARGMHAAGATQLTLTHTAAAGDETYYYVFNNADGGYVVVGGDDVAHDVLAYGASGTFDPNNMPPAMKWWLSQYEGQIHRAIQAERRQNAETKAEAPTHSRTEILPLLGKTEWFQDLPYSAHILNNVELAEADADEYFPTGCVATALAQIMRYWRYPQHGMASHGYRYRGNIFEADFSKADYKWDLMEDSYPFAYMGLPAEDAVAELMYHLGIGLKMIYDPYIGIAQPEMVAYTLRTFFGYSSDAHKLSRDNGYADSQWEQIVYEELAQGRPIVYGGGNHCFVCDGYKDGFYHINWGWNGRYNDYFLLTSTSDTPALTPNDQSFERRQEMIIGIKPDPESEGFVHTTGILDIPEEVASAPLHVETCLYNPTSQDVTVKPVLELFDDMEGRYYYLDYDKDSEFVPAKGTATIGFTIPQSLLIEGHDYYVFIDDDITEAKFTYTFFQMVDNPSGITQLPLTQDHRSTSFNIYGMPVDSNYRGIVIRGGKKMLRY